MKILQVVFKLKNSNIENLNHLINNNFYTKTIVFDYSIKDKIFENIKKYDYVIFANPNFYCDIKTIENCIKVLSNKQNLTMQYSLLEGENPKKRYIGEHYRELFATLVASTKYLNEENLIKLYFELMLKTKKKRYITTKYIGRDLRNNWHKEDIINFTIILFKYSDIEDLRNKFENSIQFIKFLDFIIDNKVFERFIEREKQFELLELFQKKLHYFHQIRQRKYTPLYLFYNLADKGYYQEALLSLTLYRSRRYWYHIGNDLELSMKDESSDIRNTKAWITTQSLRDFRLKTVRRFKKLEKYFLKIIANLYKTLSKKEVWLLSERTNSASDNSYFLYDYLQNQRKDIRSYYLIEKNAKNHLPKLKQYKNIIF